LSTPRKRNSGPFFTVPKLALIAINKKVEGTNQTFCSAVYVALRWKANDGFDAHGPFTASIGDLACRAGCSYRKTAQSLEVLAAIGVIGIERRFCDDGKTRSPSLYTFLPIDGTPLRTIDGTPYAQNEVRSVPILEKEQKEQKEVSEKGGHTHALFSLSSDQAKAVGEEFELSATNVEKAVITYRQNKGGYVAKDGPLSFDGLNGWLRTSTQGMNLVRNSKAQQFIESITITPRSASSASHGSRVEAGPAGWYDWVVQSLAGTRFAPGGTHHATDWSKVDREVQGYIMREMSKERAGAAEAREPTRNSRGFEQRNDYSALNL
jgi:hypothetical protein